MDGSTFNATTYAALNAFLGGNTLPDLRGRMPAALNQGTGRIRLHSNRGVDGNTLGACWRTIGTPLLYRMNCHRLRRPVP